MYLTKRPVSPSAGENGLEFKSAGALALLLQPADLLFLPTGKYASFAVY